MLESVCLNDMYQYHVDSNRWFNMRLRVESSKKDGEEMEDPSEIEYPWPRFNPQMCIVKNHLYIYGGILETEKVEHTLRGE